MYNHLNQSNIIIHFNFCVKVYKATFNRVAFLLQNVIEIIIIDYQSFTIYFHYIIKKFL